MSVKIEKEKEKKSDSGYGGFKKGFLGGGGGSGKPKEKKEQKITEVKVEKKSNPLEIK